MQDILCMGNMIGSKSVLYELPSNAGYPMYG